MEFATDIFSLYPDSHRTFSLIGLTLPSQRDVYFRAKQKELLDQYAGARIFMRELDTDDWSHWFNPNPDPKNNQAFQYIFQGYLYETALIYYNIIVDLSWTLCYTCAEFACTQNGKRVDLSGLKSIEESAELLRKAENNVTAPTAENNPFGYLKLMSPEFTNAIDLIVAFWTKFANSETRKTYNYCKHKGKPVYTEISNLQGGRLMGLYVQPANQETQKDADADSSAQGKEGKDDEKKIQIASDIRDVQLGIPLGSSIKILQEFDDNELFPYIQSLLKELETVIKPSPLLM